MAVIIPVITHKWIGFIWLVNHLKHIPDIEKEKLVVQTWNCAQGWKVRIMLFFFFSRNQRQYRININTLAFHPCKLSWPEKENWNSAVKIYPFPVIPSKKVLLYHHCMVGVNQGRILNQTLKQIKSNSNNNRLNRLVEKTNFVVRNVDNYYIGHTNQILL